MAASETCHSCGDDQEDLVWVRRLYITPEAWDTTGEVTVAGDELWCFVCRTHYPHQELDEKRKPVENDLSWSAEDAKEPPSQ